MSLPVIALQLLLENFRTTGVLCEWASIWVTYILTKQFCINNNYISLQRCHSILLKKQVEKCKCLPLILSLSILLQRTYVFGLLCQSIAWYVNSSPVHHIAFVCLVYSYSLVFRTVSVYWILIDMLIMS